MTAQITEQRPERRATEVAAGHAEGVAGLDRCIARLKEDIARREALLRRPTVSHIVERHPAPTKREWPAWAHRAADWLAAFGLGFMLAWLAGQGF